MSCLWFWCWGKQNIVVPGESCLLSVPWWAATAWNPKGFVPIPTCKGLSGAELQGARLHADLLLLIMAIALVFLLLDHFGLVQLGSCFIDCLWCIRTAAFTIGFTLWASRTASLLDKNCKQHTTPSSQHRHQSIHYQTISNTTLLSITFHTRLHDDDHVYFTIHDEKLLIY